MKELPALCLAIVAIVFIHATQKSGQKIPENKKKQNNQKSGNPLEQRYDLLQPKVYFTSEGSAESATLPKLPANNTAIKEGAEKFSPFKTAAGYQSVNMTEKSYYNPAYLLFHERLNSSYSKTMAIR